MCLQRPQEGVALRLLHRAFDLPIRDAHTPSPRRYAQLSQGKQGGFRATFSTDVSRHFRPYATGCQSAKLVMFQAAMTLCGSRRILAEKVAPVGKAVARLAGVRDGFERHYGAILNRVCQYDVPLLRPGSSEAHYPDLVAL